MQNSALLLQGFLLNSLLCTISEVNLCPKGEIGLCQALLSPFCSHREFDLNFVSFNPQDCQNIYWFFCPSGSIQANLIFSVHYPTITISKWIQRCVGVVGKSSCMTSAHFPRFLTLKILFSVKPVQLFSVGTLTAQTILSYLQVEGRASIYTLKKILILTATL